MRLLYVCNDFGVAPNGVKGASVHLRAITRALVDSGHEVLLLSPGPAPGPDHPARVVLSHLDAAVRDTPRRLNRWLEQRDLDTAAARELRPLLYNAWALKAAGDALEGGPPSAVIERLALMSCLGLDLSKAFGVPLIVEVNAMVAQEADRFRSLHSTRLAREIETRVLRSADAVVVVSHALSDAASAVGVPRNMIHVIPNGVDVSMFAGAATRQHCRARLGLGGEFVVGFAGSLKAWHGVDVLIAAFARLLGQVSSARLLVVGTGPMEKSLREDARRLGVSSRVTFTGAVPHERVPEHLGALDVAVAPFRSVEGFYFSPIKLMEYMAAGVCVVASRLGQIQEVIDDGVSGLLCEPDEPAPLAAALARAASSPSLRAELGAAARNVVRRRYTWSHAAAALERVVVGAIEQHRTAPIPLTEGQMAGVVDADR